MSWKLQVYSLIGIALIGFICNYLIDNNIELQNENQSLTTQLSEQAALITNLQERIQHLAELDTQHMEKLANAESKIIQLSDDLRTNVKRVYVKAQCPVPETASPSGMDDSRPARLETDAEQDYVRLLRKLETLERQFLGLRDWAAAECQR
ncbi:lysis protein [Xenorhabdus sp. DI]|uniref:lysis protein n=1 Tax=Xenorhabdus doucetiae TaxID=351671 RepID=UPI0019C53B3B|nr:MULTISPECIES: lysis protein [unclassified Xenorhabdus]MBD2785945.1 lysis protein [Xenorhabdus sp. 3]MBD2790224.1 lysis protein [Xenorhabdus sp. DI]